MTRKHILRTVLEEIIVTVDGNQIGLRLHWKGGDHTELTVRKNRHGHTRWTIDTDTELLIRELVRLMSDRSVATHLNRGGRRTGRNNSWNAMACSILPPQAGYRCVSRRRTARAR